MDIFLLGGIVLGLFALIGGIIAKGADPLVLLNPAAAIIIFIGTTAAVINSFPKNEIKKIPKLFGILFKESQLPDSKDLIDEIINMAQTSRKEGLLALENVIENCEDEFLKKGISMVVDGLDQEKIYELLTLEIEALEERHRVGATVFSSAGSYAPTLGVLGAVIGLIGALGNLNDMEKLGHMIAAAFVATLFGIFTGYVICHPFATRLKRKSNQEIQSKKLMIEGILSIQSGENPMNIRQKLICLLETSERKAFEEDKE